MIAVDAGQLLAELAYCHIRGLGGGLLLGVAAAGEGADGPSDQVHLFLQAPVQRQAELDFSVVGLTGRLGGHLGRERCGEWSGELVCLLGRLSDGRKLARHILRCRRISNVLLSAGALVQKWLELLLGERGTGQSTPRSEPGPR